MADGTFAVLMLILGITDMSRNYCGTDTGCFGKSADQSRLSFAVGEVIERRAEAQGEVSLRYDLGHRRGPFQPALGLSVMEGGETWVGFGNTWETDFGGSPFYAELHSMPGLYFANDGFDLGGPIAFRSGIEFGYENRSGWRYAISYDHRSNAGIYDENPGIETVRFGVSIPLR